MNGDLHSRVSSRFTCYWPLNDGYLGKHQQIALAITSARVPSTFQSYTISPLA